MKIKLLLAVILFCTGVSCGNGSGKKDTDIDVDEGVEEVVEEIETMEELEVVDIDILDAWDGGDEQEEEIVEPTTWYVDDLDDGLEGSGTQDDPFRDLQHAIDTARSGDTVFFKTGRYYAVAAESIDPTCGNCSEADFRVDIPITIGFHIHDKALHLVGESRGSTELHTGAGYGVYVEDAGSSSIENLMITGGIRDADGKATDAGIVVKYTTLLVRDVDVLMNDDLYAGEPDPVVGVMGITGREGANLTITGCRIHDNSWDGIALYRSDPEVPDSGARAVIVNNSIGCNSGCINPRGRGVGIGITWDARAEIINNKIFSYWKGIGSFGTSSVIVKNNVVVDQHGWGVITSGESHMEVINNVIANNGTTGLAAWDAWVTGAYTNNIIVGNGWNTDEWVGKRTGVWMNTSTDRVPLAYNDIWNNELENVCSGGIPGGTPCNPIEFDGIDGNLSVDPEFADPVSFELSGTSPLIDAGDPEIIDTDGTRSDMGIYGGPDAGREEP